MTENIPLAELFLRETNAACVLSREPADDDREKVDDAVRRLYENAGRKQPFVVWCQSIYQLVTLPSLLIGLMHSDTWQVISTNLADEPRDAIWNHHWQEAWSHLWAFGGYQLLHGMGYTSRIHKQYGHLEPALIQQAEQELSAWLSSGRVKQFEEKLARQKIYRQFWTMHMWPRNFAMDRVRILMDELQQELNAEGHRNPQAWAQYQPFLAQLREKFTSTGSSIESVFTPMGAEPVNQLRYSIWLPFGFWQPLVCNIWLHYIPGRQLAHYKEELSLWYDLGERVFSIIALENVAFVCQKPTICSIDEGGRLHSDSGPALRFTDDFSAYAWHGVIVDERIIAHPETITVAEIESTSNIEIRRVLIERYGQPRYLEDTGATITHQDEYGTLYHKVIPGDEPLAMVKVVNSTPEPDGTYKDYFLRVPPHVQTARQAVAWTFGFEEEEYLPLQET